MLFVVNPVTKRCAYSHLQIQKLPTRIQKWQQNTNLIAKFVTFVSIINFEQTDLELNVKIG